ncbi:hypothetical protein D3C81_2297160 [compost metagenome]
MTGILINWIVYHQLVTLPQIIGFALIWTALFFISNQQIRQDAPANLELSK